ncbi:hypothetical protein GCM10011321_02700 [Youhaiella tibetensis]|uniref:OsmC family protein n=1 Tax=Paradevosia tibetensis TaxID=1447062 RepID=A0A5B9DRW2_9HYPH|nr:OsmC family protein [Youhaiella tibetensis]QEE21519.1 OsmC family protein [Youhaiella tibetensis]GGF14281.1 hypothetical protein GCM10011321_02700 [Youhaiella tibetensis]
MVKYSLSARRTGKQGSLAKCKDAALSFSTDPGGTLRSFGAVDLLLASVAACLLASVERYLPDMGYQEVTVDVRALSQSYPPEIVAISYEIEVETDEPQAQLDRLHSVVRKHGEVVNTLALAIPISGTMRRRGENDAEPA